MSDVYLQVGDVITCGGLEYVVDMVNESRARATCLSRKAKVIEDKLNETQVTFLSGAQQISVSPMIERGSILRYDPSLIRTKANQSQQTATEKGKTVMAKKGKTKETKGKETHGALGSIMDHSITAILRRLGKEGVSIAHAKAILKAHKIKANDATVGIQVRAGKNGDKKRGEPAEITHAQVKELKDSAPDPEKEEKRKEKEAKEAAKETVTV